MDRGKNLKTEQWVTQFEEILTSEIQMDKGNYSSYSELYTHMNKQDDDRQYYDMTEIDTTLLIK